MKMVLTSATTPAEYVECLRGWQLEAVVALRQQVLRAAPALDERLKWGHLVFFSNGPVLLIRAEPTRVLFGFWRGKLLREIEPRLKPGGKYEMATLEMRQETTITAAAVKRLVTEAVALNRKLGDPTLVAKAKKAKA